MLRVLSSWRKPSYTDRCASRFSGTWVRVSVGLRLRVRVGNQIWVKVRVRVRVRVRLSVSLAFGLVSPPSPC